MLCEPKTVKDIYDYCSDLEIKMLTNHNADYWTPYKNNYALFDRLFMRRYKSFFPYIQEPDDDLSAVVTDFIIDVSAHLTANDKKYAELFRVWSIEDNDNYSLYNNVDYIEEYEEENGKSLTFNKGSQTDTEDLEHTKGSETDTEDLEHTKGSQEDTEDLSTTFGAQDVDTTNSTSAYNVSSFSPVDKSEVENGSHDDTQDNTRTYGQRIDSDDNSRTYGAREDTTEETGGKQYNIHKIGNMGVQTVDDMLKKHLEVWMWSFYDYVFSEIANDILRGVI